MKKIGLIGCGTVADYGHLPAIVSTQGLTLAAICDTDAGVLERAQRKFHPAQAFADSEAFFASGLDAVVVTSPLGCHCEHVLSAARRRLPVLCEKPLADDDAQAREMIEAMRRADRLLAVGFTYRFSPVARMIRKLLGDGAIGTVRSLRLVYVWNLHGKFLAGPDGRPVLNPRRVGRMLEGGPMVDCGVHQIDLARWWLGSEVARFQAHGAWVEDYDAPDHLYLHMDHTCGAHTMVEMSYTYCHTAAEPVNQFVYELIGTDGLIRYDRQGRLFEVRNARGTQTLPFASEKGFAEMYECFRWALEGGDASLMPTGEDGLIATSIARQATQQAMAQRLR